MHRNIDYATINHDMSLGFFCLFTVNKPNTKHSKAGIKLHYNYQQLCFVPHYGQLFIINANDLQSGPY